MPKPIGGKRLEAAADHAWGAAGAEWQHRASPEVSRSAPNVFPNAHRVSTYEGRPPSRSRHSRESRAPSTHGRLHTNPRARCGNSHRSQRDLLQVPELAFGALQFGLWGFGGVFMHLLPPGAGRPRLRCNRGVLGMDAENGAGRSAAWARHPVPAAATASRWCKRNQGSRGAAAGHVGAEGSGAAATDNWAPQYHTLGTAPGSPADDTLCPSSTPPCSGSNNAHCVRALGDHQAAA